MIGTLEPGVPDGALAHKWRRRLDELALVAPANRRHYTVIVVGTGLAGAAAAACLAELGYTVVCFTYHDSPRRAHSVAAQGGINAAKNYQSDGDSVRRLFLDTLKGGDFRAREANVHRLAELSNPIIDHCVAQGVPFTREYGGLLANRSFGGAQVSRTFYVRGQTGQQLLLGAYGALSRQIRAGRITLHARTEMLDLVRHEGRACGIVTRDLVSGAIARHAAHAVVLATGGYSNVYHLSTNAMASNATAVWRAYRRGALFANPCFAQIHPTCIPLSGPHQSKLTLMSESLRNDARVWVPAAAGDTRAPAAIPENERDYFLERRYPAYGNLAPRDIASRAVKQVCDEGRGVGVMGRGVYLDLADAFARLGADTMQARYGNLFAIYEHITSEDPTVSPMRIYPAAHYTMGGLWVDYDLMSNLPGLFVIGEANFSDHGANRLGASALMQGLADGYFIVPLTLGNWLATARPPGVGVDDAAFVDVEREVHARQERLLALRGREPVEHFHRELGHTLWQHCGMERDKAGLGQALQDIDALRERFWSEARVTGAGSQVNATLEKAGRIADFLELAELMCNDALTREESCGCHFRTEHQSGDGEALRDDEHFRHVAAWEYRGAHAAPRRHREELAFDSVQPGVRSYK